MRVRRLGRDSVELTNSHDDVYHVRVDASGHIQGVLPIAGTGMFSAQRQAKLDLDAMTASFAAREQSGAGVGHAVAARHGAGQRGRRDAVGGLRPSGQARPGRSIGNVVPYGAVWRTGANAATQFRTDKALDFGGTVVPAGFYTLWTIPSASGWKLVVNSETGQWGTEHKADKDLVHHRHDGRRAAAAGGAVHDQRRCPAPTGGTIHLDWDTTRASAAFKTQP